LDRQDRKGPHSEDNAVVYLGCDVTVTWCPDQNRGCYLWDPLLTTSVPLMSTGCS